MRLSLALRGAGEGGQRWLSLLPSADGRRLAASLTPYPVPGANLSPRAPLARRRPPREEESGGAARGRQEGGAGRAPEGAGPAAGATPEPGAPHWGTPPELPPR